MANITYTQVIIQQYDASPPPDDGTQVASNEITWSGIKTNLADPLKTAIESIDTNVGIAVSGLSACIGINADSPGFSANKGGIDQTGIPSGDWTKLEFPVAEWDRTGDYDTALSRWTPSETGYYEFGSYAEIDPNSNPGTEQTLTYLLALYKNGAYDRYIARQDIASGGAVVGWGGSTVAQANGTTDYFEVFIWHETGSGEQVYGFEGRAQFWGHRVI